MPQMLLRKTNRDRDPGAEKLGEGLSVDVFRTKLGWIAFAARGQSLVRMVFGYPNAPAAFSGLMLAANIESAAEPTPGGATDSLRATWIEQVRRRLIDFAAGKKDDFADIEVWRQRWTPFQRRVLDRCRAIPYGQTQTYAELGASAGSPRAARAVGGVMATNPVPLVIPCHRVVGSGGSLGGYSAIGGLETKLRLLQLEKGSDGAVIG